MKLFNCLIVDDEPIARDIVTNYCMQLPALNTVGACGNALEARQFLIEQQVDILFLDINMPVLDGIAFVKTLKQVPQIIFTTAYKEHAATAFDLAACDYLVKPFSFERFIIAVDKAIANLDTQQAPVPTPLPSNNYLFLRTEGKINKVLLSDILYAEAKGNYTSVITESGILLPAISFSAFETMLPADDFIRVHRSFIINKEKLSHIEGNRVFIGKHEIAIGASYKAGFFDSLGLFRSQ